MTEARAKGGQDHANALDPEAIPAQLPQGFEGDQIAETVFESRCDEAALLPSGENTLAQVEKPQHFFTGIRTSGAFSLHGWNCSMRVRRGVVRIAVVAPIDLSGARMDTRNSPTCN